MKIFKARYQETIQLLIQLLLKPQKNGILPIPIYDLYNIKNNNNWIPDSRLRLSASPDTASPG